jgi:hypothetical protein
MRDEPGFFQGLQRDGHAGAMSAEHQAEEFMRERQLIAVEAIVRHHTAQEFKTRVFAALLQIDFRRGPIGTWLRSGSSPTISAANARRTGCKRQ